jgi:hypothetical protein
LWTDHFIVSGPIPDDATALALAWYWSVTQMGSQNPRAIIKSVFSQMPAVRLIQSSAVASSAVSIFNKDLDNLTGFPHRPPVTPRNMIGLATASIFDSKS